MNNRIWQFVRMIVALTILCLGIPAAAAPAQSGWYTEYFTNRDLIGGPALTRYENTLHFEWGNGSPGPGVPNDNFSARWTHDEWFENGTYRFSYRSDDGIRVWVGNTLVVDDWRDRQATWASVDRVIPRGTQRVRVEYYERDGSAAMQVAWERVGSGSTAWRAQYYDNQTLSGKPVLVRDDSTVDFDWGEGSPDKAVPVDKFSVRWKRTLGFTPGNYRFYASCDDGVRIFVDGSRVVNAWYDQKLPNTHWADVTLSGGQHTITVEYYEHGDVASAHVWWNLRQDFVGWQGRYYDTIDLRGGPALIRDDAAINFDWGEGAPADWMPTDHFSVAWTRQVDFAPGYYRFNTRSDDGVRVWLDDRLLMDYWQPQTCTWHYVDGTYLQGRHTLKVEYFERTGGAHIQFWWEPDGATPPANPAPVVVAPTPTPRPIAPVAQPEPCVGGPLKLDVWPVRKTCGGGWTATIFVQGHGGDCMYTYAWERQVKGGPTPNSMTFELKSASRGIAIVGEASVTSAGQTVVVGLHVSPPSCR